MLMIIYFLAGTLTRGTEGTVMSRFLIRKGIEIIDWFTKSPENNLCFGCGLQMDSTQDKINIL